MLVVPARIIGPLTESGLIEVLVVDDDPLVRAWLRGVLRGTEFGLAGNVGSAAEALSVLAQRRVDLILVDFHLGHGVGTDVIREVRKQGYSMPAVLMTATAQHDLNERAREAGAQTTILKTADSDELLACLRVTATRGSSSDALSPGP